MLLRLGGRYRDPRMGSTPPERVIPPGERLPLLVLAGGSGSRIGGPKAWLVWDGAPLLVRLLDRLAPLALGRPIVAAPVDRDLPPGDYRRVDDPVSDAGPLAGLAAGLAAVRDPELPVAVCACDYPFASPEAFRGLHLHSEGMDLVIPRVDGRLHPLHALWRARLAGVCAELVDAGRRRVRAATDGRKMRVVDADTLGADSRRVFLNLNEPSDLRRARRLAARSPRTGPPR